MQYEDSKGDLWVEEQDDDGDVYFVNADTMESSWDLGTDERLASGIYHPSGGDDDALIGPYSSSQTLEAESSISSSWRDEVLVGFQVPQEVSEAVGRAGSAHIWPRTVDGRPSRLERWDVLKASDPYREHFSTGEAWRLEHPEFEPKLCFYAFDTAVEHVERYWVEEAEAPFRCRLQRDGLKFSRDIATWEARAPAKKNDNDKGNSGVGSPGGDLDGDEHWGGEGVGGDGRGGGVGGDGGGGNGGGDGAGFFAFPLVVHNSHAHHVDWTSGPDRYQITQDSEPEWGWTRLFTFFAYAASKYHVLETTQAPLAQKIVKGNFLTPEPGWKCVLAFFAFNDMVPGSNRYYIEEKDEPHLRTRIGMEASCRWDARHSFAAFDVPVPGSCALDVHYTIRSTDSLNPYPEQCRISLKDPWGSWEQKFRFYAFPAEQVLLSPELDSDTQDVLSGSQSRSAGDESGPHG
ncbi:hypothetical protein Esi_0030_0042 [Ectocarpus siliculosus]|uniref:WW domain-containing protein n=1 Tax=Ectocarpus siliculosus TaxID=2880 RepID=D8LKG0_ECTSI|nr:hypothetical protein Esi_0030_0042 [Ectocarpus siliculosus]|eukprot:CBN74550.1 hypothetical protein Esi_0030_0042 [Ectocarpus siliculosus]